MKTFILVLILFSTLLISIFINSMYVNSVCDSLFQLTCTLPSPNSAESDPALGELRRIWDESKGILKISVCLDKAEDIEDLIISLESYQDSQNISEFERVRNVLAGRFSELPNFERLNPFTP